MKIKNIILLTLLFISTNSIVYTITEVYSKQRIDLVLKEDLNKLQIHFEILNTTQKNIAYAISQSIQRNTDAIKFLSESYTASVEQNKLNREKLNTQLKEQYRTAKKQGVLQLQFVNRDNISFLRVHKPSKFGDDLTTVREDYKIVNTTKETIRGFTQGRTAHGFRNTFPLFDKNNIHIGAMEISFSSAKYQSYLDNVSDIHTHFLVDKKIFNSKTLETKNLVINYEQSAEDNHFMLNLGPFHSHQRCIVENNKKLKSYRKIIDTHTKTGEKFNFYLKFNQDIEIVSFLPIKNLSNKTVAWIVSYTKSDIIKSLITSTMIIRVLSFFLSLVIIYLIYRQIKSNLQIKIEQEKSEKKQNLLNEILNTTDNIMIITDFKDIKYSNDKFKSMMLIAHTSQYNEESHHNMLNLFMETDSYLHSGLLKENESFAHLYRNTRITDRKVLILNENFEPKAYSIVIQKLKDKGEYLVTLSDISELQEEFKEVENKAYIDGLTGVYNRNKFNELFSKELERVERYKEPLSITIIDIDHFKKFNDTFGHLVGDEVLVSMAQTVNKSTRETDTFARWGGEEFVIMFIDTTVDKAKKVAESLKDKIEANEHPTAGKITASFGITEYKDGDNLDTMFKRCDDALYKAKENGRNRVECL
ncbi:GGDEF domain-containing protein [Candidatus Sulfurimonas baltica]|uniref:diguanylate cyclase n=1 Tax=Candidatus Sulfurimonas baltica TaxID=2740404 RepID=A0A7S7LT97_9BACT|nr:diguanylate cyclase [Candidatus Sulfurimonas baltica]QOY50933.1 diguanylate cyclase [Candidatus Sulfurimonas baltica]